MGIHDPRRQIQELRRSAGFTLAEIIVAVTLIALLAAVLLPTVTRQIFKADANRVVQDLTAVRTGVEQFVADVHRYPGKYSDLSKVITTSNTDILGSVYPSGLVARWSGPYVTKDTLNAVVESGFGGNIRNVFTKVTNTNGIDYLTVVIVGISATDFDKVDEQVDGPSVSPAGRTTGLLRFLSNVEDSTRFLAVPIQ